VVEDWDKGPQTVAKVGPQRASLKRPSQPQSPWPRGLARALITLKKFFDLEKKIF